MAIERCSNTDNNWNKERMKPPCPHPGGQRFGQPGFLLKTTHSVQFVDAFSNLPTVQNKYAETQQLELAAAAAAVSLIFFL